MRVTGLVGEEWVELGSVPGGTLDIPGDFPEVVIPIAGDAPAVQRVRLEIAARNEGEALIIPEVEIWAGNDGEG